jgi:hypothetical protein
MPPAIDQLAHSTDRWRDGEIGDDCYAALYFLHWQAGNHGQRFASRRFRGDVRPDAKAWVLETAGLADAVLRGYLLDYFKRYQFLGVIGNVPTALAHWLAGDWPLTLCNHIPSPLDVLKMQTTGARPVTVLSAWPRMLEPVLTKPDAFAFMIHDLEHAWKFFHDPEMHCQQRDFFRWLLAALEAGHFAGYLQDEDFAEKFDYVSSDMNTHIMHASQFLRANLVDYHLRREGLGNPDHLPDKAKAAIAGLMATLRGTAWLDEVERRMINLTFAQALA